MDILAELNRWNVEIQEVNENTVKIKCPIPGHNDDNPSCIVNLVNDSKGPGYYWCPVCNKKGSFYTLLSLVTGVPEGAFKRSYEMNSKHINPKSIELWHAGLLKAGRLTAASNRAKRELTIRGISDETMLQYWIGWDDEKKSLMIPIQWGDQFINVRRYRPGEKPKFTHYSKGFGKAAVLYPQDQLRYDKIVICGGEVKALAVAQRVNKFGIGAVSGTRGESQWSVEQSLWFADKAVWICYDIDAVGRDSSQLVASMVSSRASWVGVIELPLEVELYPTGDVNDYFGPEEKTAEEFMELLEATPEWTQDTLSSHLGVPYKEVPLAELTGFNTAFNFHTTAYISGVDDSVAHKLPKEMFVKCSGESEVCQICKLQLRGGYIPTEGLKVTIDGRDANTLKVIAVDQNKQIDGWKDFFGIPRKCHSYTLKPSEELLTVRYALLSDTDADTDNPMAANIITQGEDLHLGDVCYLEGRADQSPMTTEEVRLVTKHQPRDILSEYTLTDSANLERFRAIDASYDALDNKLRSIYHDLERNVTFIYDRQDMHVLFDLSFHSPLWVPYSNALEPGWVSVLIVSETAQGKSTVMRRLMKHYGYGAYVDAANTTVAGLIGGVKTVGKRQFLKWGVLPQNDKRLIAIEEYANAPVELLRAMRSARDSGVVKLDKIDKGSAKARTRTIVLSNPKRLIPPGAVVDGLSLLEDLVTRPEDLRRFDIGMWAPRLEVDEWHEANAPIHDADSCHELLTWAWTIPPDNIKYTDDAIARIRACKLPSEFPYLYLIGGREFEVKLARLATSLAARVFSEKEGNLVVEARHVDWIINFLTRLYSDSEFGYSSRLSTAAGMDDACSMDAVTLVFKSSPNPFALAQYLNNYNRYRIDDFKAASGGGFDFDRIYQQLLIMGCLVPEEDTRWNNAYLPTRRFKKLLPNLLKELSAYDQPPGMM